MTRALAAHAWILALLPLAIACGSDSSSTAIPKIPTLSITSLTPSGGPRQAVSSDAATELLLPCDGTIAVEVVTTDFDARAPGGCGLTQLCGHVQAVAHSENGKTSEPALALLSPLLHLESVADWAGQGRIVASLVHDDNSAYLDASRAEITASIDVTFTPNANCENVPPDDGAAGAGGVPADDVPPSGGAGGAAN